MVKKRTQNKKNNKVVVVPVGSGLVMTGNKRGSGLRQSGNGIFSNLLGKIPGVGGLVSAPLKMVGLGRVYPAVMPNELMPVPRARLLGRGKYGDMLQQTLAPWLAEGTSQLGNLVRKI